MFNLILSSDSSFEIHFCNNWRSRE